MLRFSTAVRPFVPTVVCGATLVRFAADKNRTKIDKKKSNAQRSETRFNERIEDAAAEGNRIATSQNFVTGVISPSVDTPPLKINPLTPQELNMLSRYVHIKPATKDQEVAAFAARHSIDDTVGEMAKRWNSQITDILIVRILRRTERLAITEGEAFPAPRHIDAFRTFAKATCFDEAVLHFSRCWFPLSRDVQVIFATSGTPVGGDTARLDELLQFASLNSVNETAREMSRRWKTELSPDCVVACLSVFRD